jgi:hypothetical protein
MGTQPKLVACKLPVQGQTKEKSISLSERISVLQGNGTRDWNRSLCSPPERLSLLSSALAVRRTHIAVKKCFLTIAGIVYCPKQLLYSWHGDG